MKRVAAIILAFVLCTAACAGGQISTKNAPPNTGSLTTAFAVPVKGLYTRSK